jgi:hypothetical protein
MVCGKRINKRLYSGLILSILFMVMAVGLFSQNLVYKNNNYYLLHIPENHNVRLHYKEVIFSSLYKAKSEKPALIYQDNYISRVRFRVTYTDEFLYFLFLNEKNNEFPMIRAGNISIKRSMKDGSVQQMTVMIRDNSGCYIRIFPYNDRCLMDVYLYGTRIYHSIFLPYSINTIIFEPLSQIIALSNTLVDWDIVLYRGYEHESSGIISMVKTIRKKLALLHDRDDGAMNEHGEFVYIRTLKPQEEEKGFNCSGFVKWIVDGLYHPLTGRYLTIEYCKKKHLELRGNSWSLWYEDERDPYFGLDWSRNCAVAFYEEKTGSRINDFEMLDVRSVPFLTYIEDVGYSVSEFELFLFLAAKKYPNTLYIGSVNREYGKEPSLHQHIHLVVFFPYFSSDGTFHIVVLERNKETDLKTFLENHGGDYIHCVKITCPGDFSPPPLE